MRRIYIVSALIVAALTLFACATPPTEEMNDAQDAVIRAENDADAVAYAGNTLVRARDALTRMQSEAEAKRYEAAKNFAAEAISQAEKAIADGKAGAARAREEAARLVNGLSAPLAETSTALDAARQSGNVKADFAALDADMDSARTTHDAARQSLESENYPDAAAKCEKVRVTLADINSTLMEAAQAGSRKQ